MKYLLLVTLAACSQSPSSGTKPDLAMSIGGDDGGGALVMYDLACVGSTAQAQLLPVALVFLVDRSGSMGDGVNGDPALKWNPVKAALESFFGDARSESVKASLHFFPHPDLCNPSAYYTPAVTLRALPDAASFKAALDAVTPSGNTPTRPAVLGVIDYARDSAQARTAIVLVTDGEPDRCDSSVSNVSSEVERVATTTPTYVIGIGQSLSSLEEIARRGGSGMPTLVSVGDAAQTTADFLAALDKIRGLVLDCEFTVPPPPDGMTIDFQRVNVTFTAGGGTPGLLTYDKNCAGDGWRYDNEAAPTRVSLCPTTCTTARNDRNGKIDVLYGCNTVGNLIF